MGVVDTLKVCQSAQLDSPEVEAENLYVSMQLGLASLQLNEGLQLEFVELVQAAASMTQVAVCVSWKTPSFPCASGTFPSNHTSDVLLEELYFFWEWVASTSKRYFAFDNTTRFCCESLSRLSWGNRLACSVSMISLSCANVGEDLGRAELKTLNVWFCWHSSCRVAFLTYSNNLVLCQPPKRGFSIKINSSCVSGPTLFFAEDNWRHREAACVVGSQD